MRTFESIDFSHPNAINDGECLVQYKCSTNISNRATTPSTERRNIAGEVSVLDIEATAKYPPKTSVIDSGF